MSNARGSGILFRMRGARILPAFVLLLCAARAHAGALDELLSAAGAQEPPSVEAPLAGPRFTHTRIIKVLSYNIKAHPAAFLEGFEGTRYGVIGRTLARRRERGEQPDVVLLQESFTRRARNLRKEAGYPHVIQGPRERRTLLSSGLFILSEHPVLESRVVTFGPGNCRSWDCFANKGGVMARVQLPDVPFPVDIYTTHMQSGPSARADALRVEQADVLLEELLPAEPEPGVPLIFAGDFNMRPDRASYGHFISRAGLANAGVDCLANPAGCRVAEGTALEALAERTVDQHFYAPGGALYQLRPIYAERSYPLSEELSDHLAYEVHYELRW